MSAKALGFELREPTVVTVGMQVIGNLASQGDIRIEGRVEGDVRGRRVAVPQGGSVTGSVFAKAVLVEGVVRGQVKARRVRLASTAEVAMDVIYQEIIVDSGAQLNGSLLPLPASEWEADDSADAIAAPKVPELKSDQVTATSPSENTVAIPLGSGGKIYAPKETSALPKFTPVPREPEAAPPPRRGFGPTILIVAVVAVGAAGAGLGLTGFGESKDTISAAGIATEVEATAKIRAAEEEARRQAQEAARRGAEAEARDRAERAAREAAAAQARRQAEEAARKAAEKARKEAEARRQAEEEARREAAKKAAEIAAQKAAAADARRREEESTYQSALAELRRKMAAETRAQEDGNVGAHAEANTRRESDTEPAQQTPVRRPPLQQAAAPTEPATARQAIDAVKAGVAAFRRDDFDEAIARLSPAIDSGKLPNAELAIAYRRRAESFAGKKQYEQAIADYTETIRLTPGDPVAYNNRGYAFNRLGQGAKALADSSRAIEINPGYAHAYSNRCWAYQKLRQRDKAIADCRRALGLNPGLEFARKSLRRMGVEP